MFFVIILIVASAAIGCATLLESEILSEKPHISAPQDRQPDESELIEVSNFDEIKAAILDFILAHEDSGRMIIYNYRGDDVQADLDRAGYEIMTNNPIGVYAVAEIISGVTRIVTYSEVDVAIEYKRTHEQVASIINLSTERYLLTELLRIMSSHREEAVFRTSLRLSEEDIIGFVREAYYQNPGTIVMMPVTVVESFPQSGIDRVFELRFSYFAIAGIMQEYGATLSWYVRRNAERAVGESDSEILLSLVKNLVEASTFDWGQARAISVHGPQSLAATAFGALVNQIAVGEGFAMAFKALCDELRIDCRVVLGYLDGMVHAWNIVSLYGDYYHIDVAMCDVNGIQTAFLKTDDDFRDRYSWDFDNTVRCNGTLRYEDIVGISFPDDPDTPNIPPDNLPQVIEDIQDEGMSDDPQQTVGEPEPGQADETET